MRACSTLIVLLAVLTLNACGKPDAATDSPAPPNVAAAGGESAATQSAPSTPASLPTTSEVKTVDATGFKLGDYLPPLDGGKIEIAPPTDWKVLSRDSKYVVRFSDIKGGGGLPRIEVTVDENNVGGLTSVTQANLVEFTAAIAKDLEANGTAVIEPPIPLLIGAVPCARYVSHLKLKIGEGTLLVERQTLALLHAGRLYKINLLVHTDKLVESRDAAYAVCSGVRFLAADPPATE